jgi:hypothetical protein
MKTFVLLLTVAAVVASSKTDVRAQVIPDAPTCPRCRIDMRPVVKIGTADGPGSLPGRPGTVLLDGRGRYWVSALDYPRPLLYASDGRYIGEFGREGDGPGEYRNAYATAVLPGDSMLVSVPQRGGQVVIGPDLKEARTIRGDGLRQPRLFRWPTRLISQRSTFDRGKSSHTIGVYDFSGGEMREVKRVADLDSGSEAKDPSAASRAFSESLRTFANPADAHVWVAQVARYKLVRYDTDGVVRDSIIRRPSWFRDLMPMRIGSETNPPSPQLTAVAEDAQGRLWVFLAQPREDATKAWREAKVKMQKAPGGAQEGRVADMPAQYRQFRTVIEVIDPKARRVVARTTVDGFVSYVMSSNRVVTFVENEDGVPMSTIWELSLRGS